MSSCRTLSERLSSAEASQDKYPWNPFSRSSNTWRRRRLTTRKWPKFARAMKSMNCVFVDLETGGLDPDSPVCMVAALSIHHGLVYEKFEVRVAPFDEGRMTEAAKRINGWDGTRSTDVSEEDALMLVRSMFDNHPSKRTMVPLAGHFVSADFTWMESMADRCSEQWPPRRMGRKFMDTCILSTPLAMLDGVKSTSLDNMCRHLGLYEKLRRGEYGHKSALHDCYASAAVMYELMWRYT